MPSAIAVRGMLKTDSLRLRRDQFLIGMTLYILGVTVIMRWLIPVITTKIASDWEFDLTQYHSLLVSYFTVQLAPLAPGIVGGFLLLESREEGTAKALLVSPNSLSIYLSVVCLVMVLVATILTVVQVAIIALALPPWPALIAVGFAAAPAAPIFALAIAAVADNKVQAFAYLKLFGLGPVIATGAYFVPTPWQWLAVIYPPYWASKAFWVAEAGENQWPLWVLGGLVCSAVWIAVLQGLFLKAARK